MRATLPRRTGYPGPACSTASATPARNLVPDVRRVVAHDNREPTRSAQRLCDEQLHIAALARAEAERAEEADTCAPAAGGGRHPRHGARRHAHLLEPDELPAAE